jgi:hypothetical protein
VWTNETPGPNTVAEAELAFLAPEGMLCQMVALNYAESYGEPGRCYQAIVVLPHTTVPLSKLITVLGHDPSRWRYWTVRRLACDPFPPHEQQGASLGPYPCLPEQDGMGYASPIMLLLRQTGGRDLRRNATSCRGAGEPAAATSRPQTSQNQSHKLQQLHPARCPGKNAPRRVFSRHSRELSSVAIRGDPLGGCNRRSAAG